MRPNVSIILAVEPWSGALIMHDKLLYPGKLWTMVHNPQTPGWDSPLLYCSCITQQRTIELETFQKSYSMYV